jgi:predicted dehydrogenase
MQPNNRRDFLAETAALGLGFWAAGGATAQESKSPNEKLRIACIAVGGKGHSDATQAAEVGDIVAICDIDDKDMDNIQKDKRFEKSKRYNDFRKMFDEMAGSIDAVTVSTPDHTHAAASLMAMRLGKHVYCQKPLTRTVYEARLMRETAKQYKVATQMGNQGTAENGLRTAVEMIQSGAIGGVKEIHVWTNRPVWPQAPKITARPAKVEAVPKHVHWDLWLGPAPFRPYAGDRVYHHFNWRGWFDFGTGAMGDMACHTANMAFMACKLGHPTKVKAESGVLNSETFPEWARILYNFPAREGMPECTLTWYEGKKDGKKLAPPQELLSKVLKPGEKLADSGSLIVGEKGILFSPNDYGAAYRLAPEADFKDYKAPTPTLPRNGGGDSGMKREWAAAIRGGAPAMSNFDYAGLFTESMLLGNVSLRLGGKELDWDGPNLKVTNCGEAEQFIKPEYRKGWTLG